MKLNVFSKPIDVPKENDIVLIDDRVHIAKQLPNEKFTLFCLEEREESYWGEFDSFKDLVDYFYESNHAFVVFSLDDYDIEINLRAK